MAELIITRVHEKGLIRAAQGLQFLVLDELHTYRGRQGPMWPCSSAASGTRAPPAPPVHRHVGHAGIGGDLEHQRPEVAQVAGRLFGRRCAPSG